MNSQKVALNLAWIKSLSSRARRVLFICALYVILLIIAFAVVSPRQYNLSVGDVSPSTITASKDIVDEITTARKRSAAIASASSVYYKDDSISEKVLTDIDNTFAELRVVRALGEQIRYSQKDNNSFTEEDYTQASGMIPSLSLSNYQLRTLMNASEEDFEVLVQSIQSATKTVLVSTINQGQIENAISNIQQIVAYNTRTDLWYNIGIPVLRQCLRPNMLIDDQATQLNKEKASNSVEPVLYKKGQNIVVKGDRITEEQLAVLESLGVISGGTPNWVLYIVNAIFILLIIPLTLMIAYIFDIQSIFIFKNASLIAIISVLTILLSVLSYAGFSIVGLMPLPLAAMLIVSLIDHESALLANLSISLYLSSVMYFGFASQVDDAFAVLFMGLIGGTIAIILLKSNSTRMYVLLFGCVVGAVEFIILASIKAFTSTSDLRFDVYQASYSFGGVFIASLLCVGIQPVFEALFNMITPAKLIELSNPNQPLLRRLMIEAPGTYHHSMIVANLAEAAADEIGANGLLVRVGAYYHDIGKLIRPQYFKENQAGENPHDQAEPQVSAAILTEHTRDGIELAKRQHLPEQIVDLIAQHHGNTAVMYFYVKAVNEKGAENTNIDDFRYDGPKPQTDEAAILMLADTIEAAVRSIQEPTRDKIAELIKKLVRAKMDDGQLDECTLTFRDIDKICHAFETVLQGVFHERIEYPEIKAKRSNRTRTRKKSKMLS